MKNIFTSHHHRQRSLNLQHKTELDRMAHTHSTMLTICVKQNVVTLAGQTSEIKSDHLCQISILTRCYHWLFVLFLQGKVFVFDKVLKPNASQEFVYESCAKPIVKGMYFLNFQFCVEFTRSRMSKICVHT